jgi:hypothetical protein
MTDVVNKSSADESEEKQRTVVKIEEALFEKKIQYEIQITNVAEKLKINYLEYNYSSYIELK